MNTVNLTDNHLKIISKALEVYFRLRLGQISIAIDTAYQHSLNFEDSKMIEKTVKDLVFKDDLNYGIGNKKIDDANLAYEIKKTFDEVLAVKNNDGYYDMTVDFDGPLKVTDEPLPQVTNFYPFKDYLLDKKQSLKVKKLIVKQDFEKMWDYILSLNLDLSKGKKTEVVYIQDDIAIRVWKPRKEKRQLQNYA